MAVCEPIPLIRNLYTASTIDELKVLAFLENVILNLKPELAEYIPISLTEDVTKN